MTGRAGDRGIVSVLAILLLCMLCALAVAYTSMTSGSVVVSSNHAHVETARLQAESGMSFLLQTLYSAKLSSQAAAQGLLAVEANALMGVLNGTPNLGGASISFDGNTILVPAIVTDSGSFSARITAAPNSIVDLYVTGTNGTVSRTVCMSCSPVSSSSTFFGFGVAAKGPIQMTGNAKILGANDPNEANILTAAYTDGDEINLTGNVRIDGDISICDPDGNASLTGNVSVSGEQGADAFNHVHIGVEETEFPEIDPNVFAPYATNIVDSSTQTSGNKTFTNIRILAGTNPTFSGNIKIYGAVFIETPNRVQFSGNLELTGVVVTQDAGDDATADNYIHFTGNTSTWGVESLPDMSEYAELRQMPGSFLLAPGFETKFTGNFGTVNGCMAAEEFKFTGNAGGIVHGGVISYGDAALSLVGNSCLTIDRSNAPEQPPGFVFPSRLQPNPDSYREITTPGQ